MSSECRSSHYPPMTSYSGSIEKKEIGVGEAKIDLLLTRQPLVLGHSMQSRCTFVVGSCRLQHGTEATELIG